MKARELINIARLSLTLGDSRYAIALLRHLLAHLPYYLEARLLLGSLLMEKGKLEEARQQGEVVLAVDPANYEALQGLRLLSSLLARACPGTQQPAPVLARPGARGTATEIGPLPSGGGGPRSTLVLAEALWRGARWREAKRILAGLEERHPSCLRVKLMLADILLREGSDVEGASLLHEAQRLDPSMKVARELFGGLHSDFLQMDVELPLPEEVPPGPEELQVLLQGYRKEEIDVEQKEVPAGLLAEEEAEPKAVVTPLEGWPDQGVAEEEEPVEIVDLLATEEWPHQLPIEEGESEETPGESVEESETIVTPFLWEDNLSLRPMELIITSKFRLAEKYGPDGFMHIEEKLSQLERATKGLQVKRVYVDEGSTLDGLEPTDPTDPWAIKALINEIDTRLQAEGREAKFLLLVGGDDIIPFCRLPNPADDGEAEVWTDNPYASRDDNFLLPQRAVGRIPDGKKEDILLSLLDVAIEGHREASKGRLTGMMARIVRGLRRSPTSLGLSAEIWQEAAQAVFEAIGNSKGLEISPPFTDQEFLEWHTRVPPLAYFNLHGVKEAAYWYGHSSSGEELDFPIALTPLNLAWAEVSGAVVYSEACYGARLREGSADSSIPLAFLANGARAMIGSTGMAYGSLVPPLFGADLLGRNLWLGLKRGFTIGEALLRAKLGLVEEMAERQGFLDGEDQKTILSFVLYGDPSLKAPIVASRSTEPSKAELSCPSVVCGMRAQHSLEVDGEVMAKVGRYLAEKAPFMVGSELKVASQSLCAKDCNCGGGCFLRQVPLGMKKASPNLVFSSERFAPLPGDGTLKQIFRVTADQGGNVLKVAISK